MDNFYNMGFNVMVFTISNNLHIRVTDEEWTTMIH